MLPVYLAALAFGLVLIGASLFHGDVHDSDLADHDGHFGGPASDFLSLRFWTYALGAFGMTGAALHFLKSPVPVQLGSAVALGLVVGLAVSRLFRSLRRMGAGTLPDQKSLEGLEGEVVLALRPERLGKVRVRIGDQDCELPARGDTATLERGARVFVLRMTDGVAEVRPAPWKD